MRGYLGLGANLGDRAATLTDALTRLDQAHGVQVRRVAEFVESAPVGPVDQPDFLNAVAEVETTLSPAALLLVTQAIERELGRRPGVLWGPRPIDIDVLLLDGVEVATPELTVPHPELWKRAFVLLPLAELRPDLTAPNGELIGAVRDRLLASQPVRPYVVSTVTAS